MSKLIKLRLGLAAVIPEELSRKLGLEEGQEVIIKESKFGLFINPLKSSESQKSQSSGQGQTQNYEFSEDEIKVIDKVLLLKFAERTEENVEKDHMLRDNSSHRRKQWDDSYSISGV